VGAAVGGPVGATSAGANVHETTRLAATREASVVERPQPTKELAPHRGPDKGDDHPTGHETGATYHHLPPLRRTGEETLETDGQKTSPARRWVGERTLAWLSKCRGLLVRDEKKAVHVLGLLQLAGALSWMRRRARLIGD
jgi:hypothetical protein